MILIFKAESARLKTNKGEFLLKGNCAINAVSKELFEELRKLNPEVEMWLDKGFLLEGGSEENAKADKNLDDIKAHEKRAKEAIEEGEKIAKEEAKKGK